MDIYLVLIINYSFLYLNEIIGIFVYIIKT